MKLAVSSTRIQRDELQKTALGHMTQYLAKIEDLHSPGSVAVATLPKLQPAGGHTPDPVVLTATYAGEETGAELTWTASFDPALQHYEVRATPGPEHSDEDHPILATILPGNAVTFKVYIRLQTGNIAGTSAGVKPSTHPKCPPFRMSNIQLPRASGTFHIAKHSRRHPPRGAALTSSTLRR